MSTGGHLVSDAVSDATVTVAVPTRDRPAHLARCLAALAENTRPPDELIVVDQAGHADARRTVQQCGIPGARYLEQPALGLSAARNLALDAAVGAMLAVTDDDCVPDADWVERMTSALHREPRPDAVTGSIHAYGPRPSGGHAISLREAREPADHRGRLIPWMAGSGGNFAAWSEVLRRHLGWDERLGAGSPGRAAEDSELIYRILQAGGVVRYEPAAIVRHEWQTWERRLATRWSYGYGIGALCALSWRRHDTLASRMLRAYACDHIGPLGGALVRRDGHAAVEHAQALASLLPGLAYGLRLSPDDCRRRSPRLHDVPRASSRI